MPTFTRGFLVALAIGSVSISGCIQAQPPTDTGNPGLPTSPSSTGSASTGQTLAYVQDIQPVFAADCVPCHGGFRVDGNYRMTTYQQVMQDVRPGDAASKLVVRTQPGGNMYQFFSGNRQTKANMVFQWVVTNKAAQTR